MQPAFEILPSADNQRDRDADQGKHDVQVANNGLLKNRLVGIAHHVFRQEALKTVAEVRAGHRAKQRGAQRNDGHGEESDPF